MPIDSQYFVCLHFYLAVAVPAAVYGFPLADNAVESRTPVMRDRAGFKFAACGQVHTQSTEILVGQARRAGVVLVGSHAGFGLAARTACTANGWGNQRTVITRFVVADTAGNLGIVKRIPFKRQHIGFADGILPVPRRQQVDFAVGRVEQASAGVLDILHTRAAAVDFAFRVDGVERHAQFFAAIIGI